MEMIVLNDIECTRETVQWLLEQNGLDLPADSQSFRELQHAVLRAFAEAHRINAARYRGNYAVRPQDPLLARAFSSEPRARRQPKPAAAQFSDLWQRYVDGKIKAGDWGHDMQRENRMSQSLFTEIAGDRPIDAYERSQISDFVNVLQHLPAMRGKDPRFKGKTSADLVQMTKADPTIKTMQSKTVKKHFSNISSFFGWCVRQGQLPSNPAEGVYQLKRTKRRQDERAAWTNADLKTWFTCPIYQGSQPQHRLKRGQEVRRDALYWLPILAVFHALRLEEGA
ncbi:Protein of unknown function DUF3258 [Limimonas halophila]|uniref:Core-binding (CB) domain-containing protein n=2 Tax=Limimonas halophila TaxID=1082479 RepID=A0A1G7MBM4_9PROT|nr:Protein of unknown function DUF3258 [Limimonas halophila]